MFPRRRLSITLGLLLLLASLGTVRALDQIVSPGGAPDPKSGPFRPSSFVRVIDGDTFEVLIDARRTGIGVLGADAPDLGTPCGNAARAELQSLVRRGVSLEDDPAHKLDALKRRLYRVSTPDGRSVALSLVSAGLARATGQGPETAALAAAEAKARQEKTGCVWGGPLPAASASGSAGFVAQAAAHVPDHFLDDVVASSLNFPTAFAFLPDGRVLVTEKEGIVRMVTSNGLQSTPVLNIASRVNNFWDRGLIGIAVDPNFASNGRFYLFYVYESNANDVAGPKSSQLARFTLRPDGTADPNAGAVILGTQAGAGCPTPPSTTDCLPAESWSHAGGALEFAPDGNLFVSVGDGANFNAPDPRAYRVQNLDSLAGKILRIDTNGKGLNSNPYWNGNADHPRSRIWASGFRNPFRMDVRPSNGTLFVGDVGWGESEEIDVVPSTMNGGWPCYEGPSVQGGYVSDPVCQALVNQQNPALQARPPLIEWGHTEQGGASLMGTFYSGTAFPTSYFGVLFYGDYAQGWIKTVKLTANNTIDPSYGPTPFAQNIAGPVELETGPDGALWYVAAGSGELHRIRYVAEYTPIQCPDGQLRAEYFNNMTMSGAPNVARCESTIDYNWGLGSPISGIQNDNFSVRWTGRFTFGNDTYDFTTTSDDGIRVFVDGRQVLDDWVAGEVNTVTSSAAMTAGQHTVIVEYFENEWPAVARASWAPRTPNTPPTPSISSPAAGATFKVGEVIRLQGSATDQQQGSVPAANLRWDVILKHCPGFGPGCHDHPFVTLTGASANFTVPDHGDGTSFEIKLTATDSFGLTGVTSRPMEPKTVQVTLAANPSVGTVSFDGLVHTPPYTTTAIVGSAHPINAQPPAGRDFGGWAHGGAQSQTVTIGEQTVTYTANMGSTCSPRPRVTVTNVPAVPGARQVTIAVSSNPGFAQNTLKSIELHESRSATIEAPGTPATSAPHTITYPNGTTQATFTARRSQPGAILVSFTVTDSCGAWPTFVGAGPTAGW